jgi:hypothetical protein
VLRDAPRRGGGFEGGNGIREDLASVVLAAADRQAVAPETRTRATSRKRVGEIKA